MDEKRTGEPQIVRLLEARQNPSAVSLPELETERKMPNLLLGGILGHGTNEGPTNHVINAESYLIQRSESGFCKKRIALRDGFNFNESGKVLHARLESDLEGEL